MNRIITLVAGEFNRLKKYNMLTINMILLVSYLIIAYFIDGEDILHFIPFIVMIDASMMTTLLVGATLFYEKKEHTINTLIVTPVTENEILLSKILVSALNSIISVIVIAIGIYLVKGILINIPVFILATILVTAFHTLVGILLSYKSKDFSGLLMGYMVYVIVFMFPTIFVMSGVIGPEISKYFIFLPPEASNILFMSTVGDIETWKVLFSAPYLIILSIILYKFFVKPHFHKYAIKEVGV